MTRAAAERQVRFETVLAALMERCENRYGVPVRWVDVPQPFKGDLDGSQILIDTDNDTENATFMVAHLFGHTIQWNLSDRAREIGGAVAATPTPALMAELEDYELTAARYGLTLLLEVGAEDLRPWYSDYSACDFRYLKLFYATGEKKPFKSFWQDGQPLLEPLEIPDFEPKQWKMRFDGVVI